MDRNSNSPTNLFPHNNKKYVNFLYNNIAKIKIFEYIDKFNEFQHDTVKYKLFFQQIFRSDAHINITTKFNHNVKKTYHLLSVFLNDTLDMIGIPTLSHFELTCNQIMTNILTHKLISLEASSCLLTCNYLDGSKIKYFLNFSGIMNLNWEIVSLDITMNGFNSNLDYKLLEDILLHENFGENLSKLMNETNKEEEILGLIRSKFQCFQDITHWGVNNQLIKALQINDIMSCLIPLQNFQRKHKIESPLEAMKLFIDNHERSSSNTSEEAVDSD